IRINLEQDVRSSLSSGLDSYRFVHEALPELNLSEVDTTTQLFGKKLGSPILISSMTGGTKDAGKINMRLAEAAQEATLAMGVGSQRAALEDSRAASTFKVRKVAPDILLFANLGAVQLNYGYDISHCQRAVEMIDADALYLHLNPLQEAVQHGGDTNWKGLARNIERVCKTLGVPVVAKEVGWGISERIARTLVDCGVSAIDVAGAGGTSWSQVEMYRAPDDLTRELASSFVGWGIPTAESIQLVGKVAPTLPIFASGGLKDGIDIAKCIALGAALGGMAGPFLRAAAVSSEKIQQQIELTRQQLRIAMFSTGAGTLKSLTQAKLTKV
ncbi:MAG: type 2 isopentenyl-diphosphate Delta-isomerase, partial [Anaerolineaceae bacterium]|nr:type 2 isopentenyl-diphosphate Delta-isomerase [Anaerolineaceae bacterium]